MIPTFDMLTREFTFSDIAQAYETHQAVHIKNYVRRSKTGLNWRQMGDLFQSLSTEDEQSWCIEQDQKKINRTPKSFLTPFVTADAAYCSFLVQKDKKAYEETLGRLPFKAFDGSEWFYETALWIFFGRNSLDNAENLKGRTEHTDSVTHDGTWHYQLSGTKHWTIRPSDDLVERFKHQSETMKWDQRRRFHITCREGDILLLNTRLWFHQTTIPPQPLPSVSYARDFRLSPPETPEETGGMTNLDGLYATNAIEEGTILFTEKDMPDCALHRSSVNPNCEVVELEDGTEAIVASRDIAAGEFFCVPESDSEGENESDSERDSESD